MSDHKSKQSIIMHHDPTTRDTVTIQAENQVSAIALDDIKEASTGVSILQDISDPSSKPPNNINTEVEAKDTEEYVTGLKLYKTLATVTLVCFLVMLDSSIVSTAVPKITSDFHSLPDVGWYGSSYLISNCALQPLTGKLYSQFNSKWTFISFLALFELGSLLCGTAVSSTMLIIGRSVAGLGASGLTNGALTIISACVPLQKRALFIGVMMSFVQIGILLGPVVGGAVTTYASWRWCFYINLPVGGVAAAALFFISIPQRFISNTPSTSKKDVLHSLDLLGFAIFVPMTISFLLALEWGGIEYPWNNACIITLFCLSAVLLVVFISWERGRGDRAMISLSILQKRVVYSSCLQTFFFLGGMMISAYYLSIYFQAVRGVSAVESGVYTLPGVLSQMLFSAISGYLVGRLGYYLPFAIFASVMTSICYGLLSTLSPHTTTAKWVGYQIIGGMGRGCGMQMSLVAVQNSLTPSLLPTSMSLIIFSQNLGGAIAVAVAQTVFSSKLASSLHRLDASIEYSTISAAGASGFRKIVGGEELEAVIKAYSQSVDTSFYIAAGVAVASLCASAGMGWKSIKAKKSPDAV